MCYSLQHPTAASNGYRQYVNSTTGDVIDFYEIEIKPFEQQVYPGLQKARLVGYDGISPGPTFKIEKGRGMRSSTAQR